MGFEVEGRVEVVVIQVFVLTSDGKDGYAMIDDQRCGDVILGAERVAGAKGKPALPLP